MGINPIASPNVKLTENQIVESRRAVGLVIAFFMALRWVVDSTTVNSFSLDERMRPRIGIIEAKTNKVVYDVCWIMNPESNMPIVEPKNKKVAKYPELIPREFFLVARIK